MSNIVSLLKSWKSDPLEFIADVYKLKPQPLKFGVRDDLPAEDYSEDDFEPFVKGYHITWQQWLFFRAIKWAVNGKESHRISVASGHGTGKSASLALAILWFITTHSKAIIPCTAPTASQLHDVLWKELSYWISKAPPEFKSLYILTNDYLRIAESPKTWFARARTASKETPEALAGLHADHMMLVVDESSAVPDEVFEVAEGALTSKNVLVLMVTNYTRTRGYFHNSRTKDKESWQLLTFSSEESPIVSPGYITRIETLYGKSSDEYRVRVLGLPPKNDLSDADGFSNLLTNKDISEIDAEDFIGTLRLGVDPAGFGKDETVWVIRDNYKAAVVGYEEKSTEMSIAKKTMVLMDAFSVKPRNVYVDNFGVGANVAQKLALEGLDVNALNVGDKIYAEGFYNIRAYAYWMLRHWLKNGRSLIKNKRWEQLTQIKFRRTEKGSIKIMSKELMKKKGIESPNAADALMLTFCDSYEIDEYEQEHDVAPHEDVDILYPEVNI